MRRGGEDEGAEGEEEAVEGLAREEGLEDEISEAGIARVDHPALAAGRGWGEGGRRRRGRRYFAGEEVEDVVFGEGRGAGLGCCVWHCCCCC